LLGGAKDAQLHRSARRHDWNYGSYVITHLRPIDVLVADLVRPEW
jgi:hypothetical protein